MSIASAQIAERPLVTVDGAPLADALAANLVDTRVELVSNGVSEASLRFYDASFELAGSEIKFGSTLEIAFPSPGSGAMVNVFSGDVMSLAADQGPNDLHELVVTAYDPGHRLSRNLTPRTWANMQYRDIAGEIGSANGLTVRIGDGYPGIEFPHLLQTSDDATFLTELSMRTGARWRVVGKELRIGELGGDTVTATWGRNLLRFSTRVGAAGPISDITVRGWDPQAKSSFTGTGGEAEHSAAGASQPARNNAYNNGGAASRVVSNRITASQSEAEAVASAMRQRTDSALTQGRGELIGDPALQPGTVLQVESMGEHFSGSYVLTSVEHIATPRGYVTRFQAGTHSRSTLVDLLAAPAQVAGATIGIVTNNDDDELGLARVKVKFPMLGDDIESDWARVVTLGGGPSAGLQITPAVGDEVLVLFEGGDTRRPIVVGGLWNGRDRPPLATEETTESGATKLWHLQTRGGHVLSFDEHANGKENVTILLSDGATKLYLGKDKVELWSSGTPVQVKSGQANVTLQGDSVTVEGMNITLKAKGSVKIEGATVEIKGQGMTKVEGGVAQVSGNGPVVVQAGGPLALKGAVVQLN